MATFSDYCLLTGYWILFCIIHHVTAMEKCKEFFRLKMGAGFKFYRLIYSFIALSSLILVLFRQFSIKSRALEISSPFKYIVGLPLGIMGICLMFASIRKYFLKLSGVSVFFKYQQPASLELYGLHKYLRHPLYLGTLLLIWSLFLFFPLISNLLAFILITVYVIIGIQSEEQKLLLIFGETYKTYCNKTPGLIPRIKF